ncbi:PP2C family protein-serine/threonine phosphatase [Deltaproteobacteria bacterium TL4]
MPRNPSVPIKNSITTRLLKIVFGSYFIVALSLTLAHMVAEYNNTKENIINDLKIFQGTFEHALGGILWDVDEELGHETLLGMLNVPIILGARIDNDYGEEFGSMGIVQSDDGNYVNVSPEGKRTALKSQGLFSEIYSHSFRIILRRNDIEKYVGKGTFYTSADVVFEKVKYGFVFIIINSFIKTLSLWIIFLVVARRLLSRPLSILTSVTGHLDLDKLEDFKLDVQTKGMNEFKVLEQTFIAMVDKLQLSKERSTSLRLFSNRLGDFKENMVTLRAAFEELCTHISVDNAVFFSGIEDSAHTLSEMFNDKTPLLTKAPSLKLLSEIFSDPVEEVVVFNNVESEAVLQQFYLNEMKINVTDWHFVLIHFLDFPHYLILLYRHAKGHFFDSTDIEYIKSMINEIEIAQKNIEAIRDFTRMENELLTTAAVQQALFPKKLPDIHNIEFSTYFKAASESGGDWYGFIHQNEKKLYVFIGDVTGHGTPAALVTAAASATCRTLDKVYRNSEYYPSPTEFMDYLNAAVNATGFPNFLMTFFIAQIDLTNGALTFSNAGHNFPFLLCADGQIIPILNKNQRLGFDCQSIFTEKHLQLEFGDKLFFYTDGLIENDNPVGEMWGERRLVRFLRENHQLSVGELSEKLVSTVSDFYQQNPFKDDVTFVACQITKPFPKIQRR